MDGFSKISASPTGVVELALDNSLVKLHGQGRNTSMNRLGYKGHRRGAGVGSGMVPRDVVVAWRSG